MILKENQTDQNKTVGVYNVDKMQISCLMLQNLNSVNKLNHFVIFLQKFCDVPSQKLLLN